MRKSYGLNPLGKSLTGRAFEECDFRNPDFTAVTFSADPPHAPMARNS